MNKKLHVFLLSIFIGSSFQICLGNPGGRVAMSSLITGHAALLGNGITKILAQQPTDIIELGATAGIVAMGTAVVVAPIVYGWGAGSKSYQCERDAQDYRYRHECSMRKKLYSITQNYLSAKKSSEYTDEDKISLDYKKLMSDQYRLSRFKELHKEPSPLVSKILSVVGNAPTVIVPSTILLGCSYDSPEILVTGMAVSYVMAGAAYIKEKNRLKKLEKLMYQIDNEVFSDKKDAYTNYPIESNVQELIDDVVRTKVKMYADKKPLDIGYPTDDEIERMVRAKVEEKR